MTATWSQRVKLENEGLRYARNAWWHVIPVLLVKDDGRTSLAYWAVQTNQHSSSNGFGSSSLPVHWDLS